MNITETTYKYIVQCPISSESFEFLDVSEANAKAEILTNSMKSLYKAERFTFAKEVTDASGNSTWQPVENIDAAQEVDGETFMVFNMLIGQYERTESKEAALILQAKLVDDAVITVVPTVELS